MELKVVLHLANHGRELLRGVGGHAHPSWRLIRFLNHQKALACQRARGVVGYETRGQLQWATLGHEPRAAIDLHGKGITAGPCRAEALREISIRLPDET